MLINNKEIAKTPQADDVMNNTPQTNSETNKMPQNNGEMTKIHELNKEKITKSPRTNANLNINNSSRSYLEDSSCRNTPPKQPQSASRSIYDQQKDDVVESNSSHVKTPDEASYRSAPNKMAPKINKPDTTKDTTSISYNTPVKNDDPSDKRPAIFSLNKSDSKNGTRISKRYEDSNVNDVPEAQSSHTPRQTHKRVQSTYVDNTNYDSAKSSTERSYKPKSVHFNEYDNQKFLFNNQTQPKAVEIKPPTQVQSILRKSSSRDSFDEKDNVVLSGGTPRQGLQRVGSEKNCV